ncbi:subclass B3 metallo-beta-lactamase [Sphingomonas sp. CARO-RG-8B-R24-01]|uniref:subclass B3 metallo-beta-lactamase n=1 Tax=Sphingomonas sp. CARO-RG-8B-R24-01 TaxID=2914831 RepID=UPI001F5AA572
MKRLMAAMAGLAGMVCAPGISHADDPLLRPIKPAGAAAWITPQAPLHIYGNTYLVGFGALNVALIRTSAGLILIDGAVPQGVRAIEANIRRLGFRIADVKLILNTEPHFDHASGIAALARDSGATVIASAAAAAVLRSGQPDSDDPQIAWGVAYPGVRRVRAIADGTPIRLGDTIVTPHITAGHTPGSMSWTWRSCEGDRCLNTVFASSLNPIAGPGYRYTGHPEEADAFRRSFATLRALPCNILLTPHPGQSDGDVKARKLAVSRIPNPFIDDKACRIYAKKYAALFEKRIADEKAGQAK